MIQQRIRLIRSIAVVAIHFVYLLQFTLIVDALSSSGLKHLFELLDINQDGKITYVDLNKVAVKYNFAPQDFSLIEELLGDADVELPHGEITVKEFANEIDKIDPDEELLGKIPGTPDRTYAKPLIDYLRRLEPILKSHGDRPRCSEGYFRAGSFCFLELASGLDQNEAMVACRKLGSNLPILDDPKQIRELRTILNIRRFKESSSHSFWLNLRRQPDAGGSWIWDNGLYPLDSDLSDEYWTASEPNGASEMEVTSTGHNRGPDSEDQDINSARDSKADCAVAYLEDYGRRSKKSMSASGAQKARGIFADESCETRNVNILTLCQRRPDFVDIGISHLNKDVTDADLHFGNIQLQYATVSAGKSQEELDDLRKLLSELNGRFAETQNINVDKTEQVPASLVHDVFPDTDCLKNRIRNVACVPAAGRRKRRHSCFDRKRKRAAFLKDRVGWSQRPTIYYEFDASIRKESSTFLEARKAISFWQSATCVDFVDTGADQEKIPDVIIVKRKGCWSSIGRDFQQTQFSVGNSSSQSFYSQGDRHAQILSLGPGCDKFYIAAHEFGHLLGLDHEQARQDRDSYVKIIPGNIDPSYLFNFDRCVECCEKPTYPYDYGSIMHYAADEFAKNEDYDAMVDVTLTNLYRNTMGNAWFPSFFDVWQVNKLLCSDICSGTKLACQNSGYAHPRKCDVCICPDGFSGPLCDTVAIGEPEPCGGILNALNDSQLFSSPGFPNRQLKYQQCTWIIKAPPGYLVEARFVADRFGMSDDCRAASVQIRFQADLTVTGPLFCGSESPPVLRSETDTMMVLLRVNSQNDTPMRGFIASYRAVKDYGDTPLVAPLNVSVTDTFPLDPSLNLTADASGADTVGDTVAVEALADTVTSGEKEERLMSVDVRQVHDEPEESDEAPASEEQ